MQTSARLGKNAGQPANDLAPGSSAIVVCAALDGECSPIHGRTDPEFTAALTCLERADVPVMVWSSHTRAEIELLRQALGIHGPFISEGGAALFVPAGYFTFLIEPTRRLPGYDVVEFGEPHETVVAALRRVASRSGVDLVVLSDMTIEEAAREFDLSLLAARLAKLREYGELFRVTDHRYASRGRLLRALHSAGLACVQGDRYDAVTGVTDRAAALQAAYRLMQRARGRLVRIGIGSRAEDLPVLAQADVRIVVQHRDRAVTERLVSQLPSTHVIEVPGAEGWIEAISRINVAAARHAL